MAAIVQSYEGPLGGQMVEDTVWIFYCSAAWLVCLS
jgi:hypothetical protein